MKSLRRRVVEYGAVMVSIFSMVESGLDVPLQTCSGGGWLRLIGWHGILAGEEGIF